MTMTLNSKAQVAISETQRTRGVEILAKTLYRDLISHGYEASDVVNLATQLIDQVTAKMGEHVAQDD